MINYLSIIILLFHWTGTELSRNANKQYLIRSLANTELVKRIDVSSYLTRAGYILAILGLLYNIVKG